MVTVLLIIILIISFSILVFNFWGLNKDHYPVNLIPADNQHRAVFGRHENQRNLVNLSRQPWEIDQDYITRLNILIGSYVIHYLPPNRDLVPWSYNFILRILYCTRLKYFQFYEFYNGQRAIRKGYGLCSQIAIIIWFYVRSAGISIQIIRLPGHVINRIIFKDGTVWLVDADYQVIIPHSLETIKNNIILLNRYYHVAADNLIQLQQIFQKDYTVLTDLALRYRLLFENAVFIFKWLFPIIMISVVSIILLSDHIF